MPRIGTSCYSMHLPIMRKSLKSLFNGTVDRVYAENDTVADEMFNNLAKQTGLSCSQTNRKDRKVFVLAKNSIMVLFAAGL